eukprot:c8912_g1_i3.p2 GENE.c8912_g1_i3~~c8912_g1_i3.p2  ORF type:complete len:242 (-),score=38.65 c8912_g1_i3:2110-2835(-)
MRVVLLCVFAVNLAGGFLTMKSKMARIAMTLSNSPNRVVIEVDGVNAPITSANFVDIVNNKIYDGTVFFRVIDDFVAQGGDPAHRGPEYSDLPGVPMDLETGRDRTIPLEIRAEGEPLPEYRAPLSDDKQPVLKHVKGAVAMARTNDPNSASTQFYFVTGSPDHTRHLDGSYAVFGHVIENIEAVLRIKKGDFIEQAVVLPPGCDLEEYIPPTRQDLEKMQQVNHHRFWRFSFFSKNLKIV